MRLLHDNTKHSYARGNQAEPSANGGERRVHAAALLDAAHEAINRALSQNSLEFLERNKQAGGE